MARIAAFPHTPVLATPGLLSGLLDAWKQYRARRAAFVSTFNELSQLSDRELNDLNLTRGTLRQIAEEAARKVRF